MSKPCRTPGSLIPRHTVIQLVPHSLHFYPTRSRPRSHLAAAVTSHSSPSSQHTQRQGLPIPHCPTASHLVSRCTPISAHPAPQLGSSCSRLTPSFSSFSLFFFPPFPSEKPGPCQGTQTLLFSGPWARQE